MRRQLIGFLFVLAVCPIIAVAGGIYKWVDKNGITHYGAQPGASNARPVKVEPAPHLDGDTGKRREKRDKLLKAFEEERKIKKENEAKARAERKRRERSCRNAKNELQDYRAGGALYELGENGSRHFLTRADLAERIKYWQAMVDRYCD